ncbi:P-loop containing nucleoside triphosphate hydrolase protein [Absidia repens]|uniref:p-loop containing nucleoside triphosphate hydrolase protein n=1 Tax=Absidia repens TaxID=90262 RepID=A0A1X2IG94_9FUNG|nr:P-loop containing nucleoside triphosphate hydrolase protein [Absidia repens]
MPSYQQQQHYQARYGANEMDDSSGAASPSSSTSTTSSSSTEHGSSATISMRTLANRQNTAIADEQRANQYQSQNRPKRATAHDSDKSSDDDDDDDMVDQDDGYGNASDSDFDDMTRKKTNRKHAAASSSTHKKSNDQQQAVFIPMGTKVFEKILRFRHNEDSDKDELLVKYKHTSYHRAEWVSVDQIESEHLGKHRVKKFLQKWHQDGQVGEDFTEYLKLDRIIDEGELADPITGDIKIYYLVKWNGLLYDASTWESEVDIQAIDPIKIQEFHTRRQIPQEKLANSPSRPPISQFSKYDSSPKYRYGNELRSYQLEGLNWLRFCYYSYRSCILADEMGLGKTVQSVAFLNDIYHNIGIRGPFLIVAPLSTIPHWERAFRAWTDLNVIDFRGNALSRSLLIETEFYYKDMQGKNIPHRYKFDALITTYEMAIASASQLRGVPWKCAVFDEAHRLKNKQSKVGEILKMFHMDQKLLLTGTPLQNNLDELYSLLSFMQPDVFSDEKQFFAEYGSLHTAAEVEKLQYLLKPIMLRRFKEDVEKSIPVKEETVIEVELTNPQKKWYRAILEKNFSFLKKGSKTNKEMPHLRNIMMQLRKCCIHPYLLEGAEEVIVSDSHATTYQEQFNCLVQSSGKLVLIDKLLKKLIKGNHKVLIFSQFTSCLDILSDYLRGRNYAHERIDGSIPGEQRQASIDRFSTLPIEESFVFLLCTRAGGVGINLTAADTCIIFDSDWNPQNDLQAQARCHRIGQTKPVQIYRLICRNTYEKDMFDRAGMKLGLDKAVMQRSNTQADGSSGNGPSKNELNKKEIEDLLKKGAYGAMLDDEASTKFCEEDIDQILERRTTVIRHEGNEKGSVFSKATFSASSESNAVELDDPDFWEKWATQANIDTTEAPDDNDLIVFEPRRRRQVQRFGTLDDDILSPNDNEGVDSDAAYEDEGERNQKRELPRPWTLSEKTKFERKLMIFGYGAWDQMATYFSRRSGKDLKAAARSLMRQVLPQVTQNSEEDRKLIEDIEDILETDDLDEVKENLVVPYRGASKKQITEFKSFLLEAPSDYIEHIERKGRNLLLRIQMLYLVRDRIVPKDWEEAKVLPIPKVTGNPPSDWWGDNEDRDLLLGICKHGYQQYLTMRNDPEFSFYGKKFDDSKAGALEDDDTAPAMPSTNGDDSQLKNENDMDITTDEQVHVWPSKADIGMRLRRIIAAFLREEANDLRRQKVLEKAQLKEGDKLERQRQRESRQAERQRSRRTGPAYRWHKRNKADFLRTVLSFGVETVPGDPNIRWDRFREISGLDNRPDDVLDAYYLRFVAACEEIMKRQKPQSTSANNNNINNNQSSSTGEGLDSPSSTSLLHVPSGDGDSNEPLQHDTPMLSRESSAEPTSLHGTAAQEGREGSAEQDDTDLDLVPYDKARRSLKRIGQMKRLRESVLVHPSFEENLMLARKTSGLPSWWKVPDHDRALLQGICKHGYSRSDLLLGDPSLAFYHIKQHIIDSEDIQDPTSEEGNALVNEKLAWPKDIVIARRIESLCELILKPRPAPKRLATSRKRPHDGTGPRGKVDHSSRFMKHTKLTLNGPKLLAHGASSSMSSSSTSSSATHVGSGMYGGSGSDDMDDSVSKPVGGDDYDSGEDTDDILQEASKRMQHRHSKTNNNHSKKSSSSSGAAGSNSNSSRMPGKSMKSRKLGYRLDWKQKIPMEHQNGHHHSDMTPMASSSSSAMHHHHPYHHHGPPSLPSSSSDDESDTM